MRYLLRCVLLELTKFKSVEPHKLVATCIILRQLNIVLLHYRGRHKSTAKVVSSFKISCSFLGGREGNQHAWLKGVADVAFLDIPTRGHVD